MGERQYTVAGERVALAPHDRTLVPTYCRWVNDLDVTRFLRSQPMTLEQEYRWFDSAIHDPSKKLFTIFELPTEEPIGTIDLHEIDTINRTASLGIMIGEASARGRGLGTEAVRLICDYGFNVLNLHSIHLLTAGWNIAGQRAYVKAGFKEVGRMREFRYFAGRYWDDIYYDILESEFESPVLKKRMTHGLKLDPT